MKQTALLAMTIALTLLGCKKDLKNGEIPEKYLEFAKSLTGSYQGKFNDQSGTLTLALQGNKVVATWSGSTDILGGSCQTQIGNLKSIEMEEANGQDYLETAVFQLNHNGCVQGNSLTLTFNAAMTTFKAEVLHSTWSEETCPSESEIDQCADDNIDDFAEDPYTDGFGNDCRPDPFGHNSDSCQTNRQRTYSNCGSCYSTTHSSSLYGSFRR